MVSNWSPLAPLQQKIFIGRTVRVEELSAVKHGQELFDSFAADAEGRIWTYGEQDPFASYETFHTWLAQLEVGEQKFAAYIDQATEKATGIGALREINYAHGTIQIGSIMLSPMLSRTMAATEALYLQIDSAFGNGFRRISWTCDVLNGAAVRAAHRLGFSFEATFQQACIIKGRNCDKAIFSITDDDWPAIGNSIRQWLAPENFDEQGQQRCSLRKLTSSLVLAWAPPGTHTNSCWQPIGPLVQWAPAIAPTRDLILQGRTVRIEPLSAEHAHGLHSAYSDAPAEHWSWLPYGPFENAVAYAEWVEASIKQVETVFFAILVNGSAVGVAAYLNIFPVHGSIEVGHVCFAPCLKQSVEATEAMFLMMKWAFEAGYRRYEWKCNARNSPSRRAARRFGFSFEGILRQTMVIKGDNRDSAYFSAIDPEWPRLKEAFETWLAPGNFDAGGVNLRSLSTFTRKP